MQYQICAPKQKKPKGWSIAGPGLAREMQGIGWNLMPLQLSYIERMVHRHLLASNHSVGMHAAECPSWVP